MDRKRSLCDGESAASAVLTFNHCGAIHSSSSQENFRMTLFHDLEEAGMGLSVSSTPPKPASTCKLYILIEICYYLEINTSCKNIY